MCLVLKKDAVSYVAHLAGAAVGLLMGIIVLRNLREHKWETMLWWACLVLFSLTMGTAVIWSLVDTFRPEDES